MMRYIIPFLAIFFLLFSSCDKSREVIPEVLPPEHPEELSWKEYLESEYGISFTGSDNLEITEGAASPDGLLLSVSGERNGTPWSGVFDIESKKQIFDYEFKFDPQQIHIGYGDSAFINYRSLRILYKSSSLIFGERVLSLMSGMANIASSKVLFVAEIGTNKIVEYSPFGDQLYEIREWRDNSFLVLTGRKTGYRVINGKNEIILEGKHEDEINIDGEPVSYNKSIVYTDGAFEIHSLQNNRIKSVLHSVAANENDKVVIDNIEVKDSIATITFKITTNRGVVSEKTVRLDFENYAIVED